MKLIINIILFLICNVAIASKTDSLYNHATNENNKQIDRIKSFRLITNHLSTLDTSIFFLNNALQLAYKIKDTTEIAKSIYSKGIIYGKFNDLEKEIISYNKALSYLDHFQNDDLKMDVLIALGITRQRSGSNELAINTLKKALSIAKSNNNLNQELRALNTIGNIEMSLANYSKAQITFLEALDINKQLKNDFFQVVLTNNIGNIYFYLFNYEKAITYYFESLRFAEKINDEFYIVSAYNNIGIIYKDLKRYDDAIIYITKALNYHLEHDDKYRISESYNSLGTIYIDQNKPDSALPHFETSLRIKQEIKDSSRFALVYSNIGNVYFMKKNVALTKKNLTIALKAASKYNDYYIKSTTYISFGNLYTYLKDKNKAIKHFQLALNITEEHGLKELSMECYEDLYECYKENGSYKNSLYYFEKYKIIKDSLGGETSKLKIEEIETKYEVDKKDTQILLLQKEKELEAIKLKEEQEKSRTNMLLSLLGIGIIILVATIVFIKVRQKQKNKITSLEKKGLKVETEMLRSQMNPHFIFNSLNAIQSFISGNETIDAERYLAKFAELMRLILDNSRTSFVVFENEIETLNLYLELEKLRFDNRFNFNININNIDDEFTLIPPMLAQPYIENAILHGLSSKTNGEINISYKQTADRIICTIDDNGIGRAKAMEIKAQSTIKKSSVAIQLTQDRIDLLSEEFNVQFNLSIIDKKDTAGIATGTKVIIEMPFKESL